MARRPAEQKTINHFAIYLSRQSGRQWTASQDEVLNPKNGRNYDCEFTSPNEIPIACDVASLFPSDNNPTASANRARFNQRLFSALDELGIRSLIIHTPPIRKKHGNPAWFKQAACAIQVALDREPEASILEVEGIRIVRAQDKATPLSSFHSQFSMHQPIETSGRALVELLEKKRTQIDVPGHHGALIAVNDGSGSSAGDVTCACAFIDFTEYQEFRSIYFEESPGHFHLVYDREANQEMEAGRLPLESEQRRLVSQWIDIRLARHWPGALDLALRISWEVGDRTWLSSGGQDNLSIAENVFMQQCGWSTPRQLWEAVRGPMRMVGDGRPTIGRIRSSRSRLS
jgi:hypothetical protein